MDHHNSRVVQELAKRLGRPISSLLALSPQNDPFYLSPARCRDAEWFAELYQEHGFGRGVHLRRIHYRFISLETAIRLPDGGEYLNTVECWGKLLEAAKSARYAGLISPERFIDQRNPEPEVYLPGAISSRPEIMALAGILHTEIPEQVPNPSLGLYGERPAQPYHVEIWCEKSTVNDVLIPLAYRYGLNIQTSLGEMSLTRCNELVERAAQNGGRPVRILYISDFDPAGQSMPVATARKIEWALEGDHDIQLQPIALTHEQCLEHRLPRTPIKETELRGRRFEARFGEGATELDALEALHPGILQEILTGEIERFYDWGFDQEWALAKREAKARLDAMTQEILTRHANGSEFAQRLADLRRQAGELSRDIAAHNEAIEDELQEASRGLKFEWPVPREGEEWPDPLFDSRRDYPEQINRYKEHQGKPTGRRRKQQTESPPPNGSGLNVSFARRDKDTSRNGRQK